MAHVAPTISDVMGAASVPKRPLTKQKKSLRELELLTCLPHLPTDCIDVIHAYQEPVFLRVFMNVDESNTDDDNNNLARVLGEGTLDEDADSDADGNRSWMNNYNESLHVTNVYISVVESFVVPCSPALLMQCFMPGKEGAARCNTGQVDSF
jgi:hypothetical protein